jgi:hypothetical protein
LRSTVEERGGNVREQGCPLHGLKEEMQIRQSLKSYTVFAAPRSGQELVLCAAVESKRTKRKALKESLAKSVESSPSSRRRKSPFYVLEVTARLGYLARCGIVFLTSVPTNETFKLTRIAASLLQLQLSLRYLHLRNVQLTSTLLSAIATTSAALPDENPFLSTKFIST